MPAAARQPRCHIGRVLGVVEDQQPPAPLPQLGQHHRPHHLRACLSFNASQREPQSGDLVPDQPALLGVDPPGQVIGSGEPVRVLGRQLGLTHPAHPMQRLHQRLLPGQQPLPHRHQQTVSAGEPRITRRDIPHPRHSPRQPRTGAAQPAHGPRRAMPGNTGLRSGRRGPATACSSTRRACSSATPNRSRHTSGRKHRGHLPGGHLLHPHRHQLALGHAWPACSRLPAPAFSYPAQRCTRSAIQAGLASSPE